MEKKLSPNSDFPNPLKEGVDLLIIAGEHSGDQHGAKVVAELKKLNPELNIVALGGSALEVAGAQLLFDLTQCSIVGYYEVLKNYNYFKTLFNKTISWIRTHKPKNICLIDYPGFNLRLAQKLFKLKLSKKGGGQINIVNYIGPQVWAWKKERRFKMAEWLDALGVIFPFEVDSYKDTDLPVQFVGHPFIDFDYQAPVIYDEKAPILLLAGSRENPVKLIFPTLVETFRMYLRDFPDETAVTIYPSEKIKTQLEGILNKYEDVKEKIKLAPLGKSVSGKAVLTSSGTMSLACALAGIPGAIVYRTHPISYLIGKKLIKIPYLGIANILLNRPVYQEYIQRKAKPDSLRIALKITIEHEIKYQIMKKNAESLRQKLKSGNNVTPAVWLSKIIG